MWFAGVDGRPGETGPPLRDALALSGSHAVDQSASEFNNGIPERDEQSQAHSAGHFLDFQVAQFNHVDLQIVAGLKKRGAGRQLRVEGGGAHHRVPERKAEHVHHATATDFVDFHVAQLTDASFHLFSLVAEHRAIGSRFPPLRRLRADAGSVAVQNRAPATQVWRAERVVKRMFRDMGEVVDASDQCALLGSEVQPYAAVPSAQSST